MGSLDGRYKDAKNKSWDEVFGYYCSNYGLGARIIFGSFAGHQ